MRSLINTTLNIEQNFCTLIISCIWVLHWIFNISTRCVQLSAAAYIKLSRVKEKLAIYFAKMYTQCLSLVANIHIYIKQANSEDVLYTLRAIPSMVENALKMSVKYGGKQSLYFIAAELSWPESSAMDAFWRPAAPPRTNVPANDNIIIYK